MPHQNATASLYGGGTEPGLLEQANAGELVIPEFQREWVWGDRRTLQLLRTIGRGWPAGSLLLHQGDGGFPSRSLTGVGKKPANKPAFSILDGQQRLTALYQSLPCPSFSEPRSGRP
jgi:uncharacterized protein with ParB-like and HNH nuclease domain